MKNNINHCVVNCDKISEIFKMVGKASACTFIVIGSKIRYDGEMFLSKPIKKEICESLDITISCLRKHIKTLVQNELLFTVERNVYFVNPYYISKGSKFNVFMQRKKLVPNGYVEPQCEILEDENLLFLQKIARGMNYEDFLESEYWQIVRQHVLERDDNKCCICDSASKLHVHHKTYEHHFNEHNYTNDLITLCRECHEEIHNIKR